MTMLATMTMIMRIETLKMVIATMKSVMGVNIDDEEDPEVLEAEIDLENSER